MLTFVSFPFRHLELLASKPFYYTNSSAILKHDLRAQPIPGTKRHGKINHPGWWAHYTKLRGVPGPAVALLECWPAGKTPAHQRFNRGRGWELRPRDEASLTDGTTQSRIHTSLFNRCLWPICPWSRTAGPRSLDGAIEENGGAERQALLQKLQPHLLSDLPCPPERCQPWCQWVEEAVPWCH